MKKLILIVLFFAHFIGYSQNDSTKIKFSYTKDLDLVLANELNKIQMIDVICDDSLMRTNKFFLSIKEYLNGKMVNENNLISNCEIQEIPLMIGKDTAYYQYDPCEKISFNKKENEFKVKFAGKLENDIFNLIIRYPSLSFNKQLKGNKGYLLKPVQSCSNDELKFPLNKKFPILAYTLPFDTGSGFNSYCLLGEEQVEKWFETFKISHYYVFYLEIKN